MTAAAMPPTTPISNSPLAILPPLYPPANPLSAEPYEASTATAVRIPRLSGWSDSACSPRKGALMPKRGGTDRTVAGRSEHSCASIKKAVRPVYRGCQSPVLPGSRGDSSLWLRLEPVQRLDPGRRSIQTQKGWVGPASTQPCRKNQRSTLVLRPGCGALFPCCVALARKICPMLVETGAHRALGAFDAGTEFLDIGGTRGAHLLACLRPLRRGLLCALRQGDCGKHRKNQNCAKTWTTHVGDLRLPWLSA